MYKFYAYHDQIKKSKWVNKKNILVIHHSGGPTFKSFWNTRINPKNTGSYQFVIDELGQSHKFGDPDDIAHQSGESWWGPNHPNTGGRTLNGISLGLCVIWPLKDGWFNDLQRQEAVKLTRYLMKQYKIDKSNLVRHIDITQYDQKQIKWKIYYNGQGKCRKPDIAPGKRDRNKFLQEVFKDLVY